MLCGLLDPSGGSAKVAGFDVAKNPDLVKQRIGYMTQRFSLYEDLSIQENLEFYAALYGVPRSEHRPRIEAMLEEGGLVERRTQLAGTLSGGWKQRLALACATVHRPKLVFLDEPTAGVDPVSRREFWERIHELSQGGTTLIVTTHYIGGGAGARGWTRPNAATACVLSLAVNC
jgi:ABC-2 type transport system ATP-binding protein